MQADILDWEKFEKDRRIISREKKVKKEKRRGKKIGDIRKVEGELLREVIVKIGLERIDIQKRIMVEALLNSRVIELVISLEFAYK